MLFIAQKPTLILITPTLKLIITTPKKLIFTTLDFVQQCLSTNLIYPNPTQLSFSQSKQETIVITLEAIELYYCNWDDRVQLRIVIVLHQDIIYSVLYEGDKWKIFGQITQYSPKGFQFYACMPYEKECASCWIGGCQFLLAKRKIYVYDHCGNKKREMVWKQAVEHFSKLGSGYRPTMRGATTSYGNYILAVDDLCLIISQQFQLIGSVHQSGFTSFSNNVLVWMTQSNKIRVRHIVVREVVDLGETNLFDGQYYGAAIAHSRIHMLFYDFKEFHVKYFDLADHQTYNRQIKQVNFNDKYTSLQEKTTQNIQNNGSGLLISQPYQKDLLHSDIHLSSHLAKHKQPNISENDSKSQKSKDSKSKSIKDMLKESIFKFQEELYHQFQGDQYMMFEDKPIKIKKGEQESSEKVQLHQQMEQAESIQLQKQIDQAESIQMQVQIQQAESIQLQEQIDQAESIQMQVQMDQAESIQMQVQMDQAESIQLQVQMDQAESIQLHDQMHQAQLLAQAILLSEYITTAVPAIYAQASNNTKQPEYNLQVVEYGQQEQVIYCEMFQAYKNFDKQESMDEVGPTQLLLHAPLYSRVYNQSGMMLEAHIPACEVLDIKASFNSKDRWGNVNKSWQQGSYENKSYSNSSRVVNIELMFSDKVKYFTPEGIKITTALAQEINRKKYTHLMQELYRRDNDKFEEYTYIFLKQILQEDEARIFFVKHIRIFNPELTKDRILRLYMCLEDTEENKMKIMKALSEFKMVEIPRVCFPFKAEVVEIFMVIYPNVYIEDLLKPSIELIDNFLQSYFCSCHFPTQQILLQDERINITQPRNILNIILYLNEDFDFTCEQLLEIYVYKLLKYEKLQVVKKLVADGVLEMCGVSSKVVEHTAGVVIRQMLVDGQFNLTYIQHLTAVLGPKRKEIQTILTLVDYLNLRDVSYTMASFFELSSLKNCLLIVDSLVQQNTAQVISNINISTIFILMWLIQQGKPLKYYNQVLVDLIQHLAIKLMKNQYYFQALDSLVHIRIAIKRGFIAKLLYNNVEGKFINRLCNIRLSDVSLQDLFRELCFLKKEMVTGDKLQRQPKSDCFLCEWRQFYSKSQKIISLHQWEIHFSIYMDLQFAMELVEYNIVQKTEMNQLLTQVKHLLSSSSKKLKNASIKIQALKIPISSNQIQQNKSNQTGQINYDMSQNKSIYKKRMMRSMNNSNEQCSRQTNLMKQIKVIRSKSETVSDEVDDDDDSMLLHLKMEVGYEGVLIALRQFYQESPCQRFIRATQNIDRQRVHLYHIDIFKHLIHLSLSYPFESLVPFQYFLSNDSQECLDEIRKRIRMDINAQNFWIIYLIVQLLYEKGKEAALIFIQKIIIYEKNDQYADIVSQLIDKFQFEKYELLKLYQMAQENAFCRTAEAISRGIAMEY